MSHFYGKELSAEHPFWVLVSDLVGETLDRHVGGGEAGLVRPYLTGLVVGFMRMEAVYAVRDASGVPVQTVTEMVAEGDVRLNASSFEREREVHKHIGDFILFWSGVYPDFLRRLRLADGRELLCDYTAQGKASYEVVGSFDLPPHDGEAPTFRALSAEFEAYMWTLREVGRRLPLYAA